MFIKIIYFYSFFFISANKCVFNIPTHMLHRFYFISLEREEKSVSSMNVVENYFKLFLRKKDRLAVREIVMKHILISI